MIAQAPSCAPSHLHVQPTSPLGVICCYRLLLPDCYRSASSHIIEFKLVIPMVHNTITRGDQAPKVPTATVSVHALSCGHFSLPEYQFIHPVSQYARRTVPSLAFLVQHTNQNTCRKTRIVFDLGLRRDITRYAAPIQKHIESRQPMTTLPDVTQSLARGGLKPDDIDHVIYSHVS
jgi:hypothetical protein